MPKFIDYLDRILMRPRYKISLLQESKEKPIALSICNDNVKKLLMLLLDYLKIMITQ